MTVEEFFEHLLDELDDHPVLRGYYRFKNDPRSFEFRKAYYCQRLHYILDQARRGGPVIWDVGCGYGTTAIFLCLNGFRVHGSTLEYYFREIPQRIGFWSRFGDVSGFTYAYENLYDSHETPASYDSIVVQDTLHHTEPIDEALAILWRALRPGGRLIAVEENGNNVIQNAKLFLQRGNKRIIEIEDERLGRKILLGNENIRPFSEWKKLCTAAGFSVEEGSVHYVRVLPPFLFGKDARIATEREQNLWKRSPFLRERFFFGLNFCAVKPD